MKQKTVYFCSDCGTESPKWMGKCPGCGAWNTMVEELVTVTPKSAHKSASIQSNSKPQYLRDIAITEETRTTTGFKELDRVLGGGIVSGSLILLGGDPGIGKSTLLLQTCGNLGADKQVLYVSGEESGRQIKLRADRLGVATENLKIYSETNMTNIISCIYQEKPDILIIDSVQTMFNPEISPAPGSVSQIRDVAATLMRIAKEESIATFVVGHVTKDGAIAGPKILEHIVDCVLYFEGEQHRSYRIIRAIKNRFGSTNEIGVFEMADKGLIEIENPSLALLSGRPEGASGSCILCTMEGTRPVLAEIQALAAPTSFGNPRRMTAGVELSRTLMLLAVMEKRLNLKISAYDVYVNVVGGLKMVEPSVDMGIILAIASSLKNKAVDSSLVAIGEVGLAGEIRACSLLETRVAEAEKLGFKRCIIPEANAEKLRKFDKIQLMPFSNIKDVLKEIL